MLARCFLFLFCGEGMTAGHGLWFVLPVYRGKGLTSIITFSCGVLVNSHYIRRVVESHDNHKFPLLYVIPVLTEMPKGCNCS